MRFLLRPHAVNGQLTLQSRLGQVGVRRSTQISATRPGTLVQRLAPRVPRTNRRLQIRLTADPWLPTPQTNLLWVGAKVNWVNKLNRVYRRIRPLLPLGPELIVVKSQLGSESSRSQRLMPILRGREFLLRPQAVSQLILQSRLRQMEVRSSTPISVTTLGTLTRKLALRVLRTNRRFQPRLIMEPRSPTQQTNPRWAGHRANWVNVSNCHRTRNRPFPPRVPELIVGQRQQSNESSRTRTLMPNPGAVLPAREPGANPSVTGLRVRTRTTCCGSRAPRRESRSTRVRGRKCGRTASAAWKSISERGGCWSGATWTAI